MKPSFRPVTPLDHGVSKGTLIHAGLVFAGHLDIERLRLAAEKLINTYPDLRVVVKRKLPSLGRYATPPTDNSTWNLSAREWPEKTLAEIFPPASTASSQTRASSSGKIAYHGAVNSSALDDLFSFSTPPIIKLGIISFPVVMFRVTTLGTKPDGHTALGLIVPHVMLDGTASAELIQAWGKLYHGESLPDRMVDPHPDLLQALGAASGEGEVGVDETPQQQVRPGQKDGMKYIIDSIRNSSKGVEEHYLHIPSTVLEAVRDEARSKQGQSPGLPVSKMDVFCAMMLKLFANSSLAPANKPFDFYHAYTFFSVFPRDSLPTPYLHNLFTFGRFPFPSATSVASSSLAELATTIRTRLNGLRTKANVREQLVFYEHHQDAIQITPRWDAAHGTGMISSWMGCYEKARGGFEGRIEEGVKLVFVRPRLQFPLELKVPNIAIPFGDGEGGFWCTVSALKGDWERMWTGAALENL